MSDFKRLRKRWYVDSRTQGALVFRITAYWLLGVVGVVLMTVAWGGGLCPGSFSSRLVDMWPFYGPAVLVLLLLLPLLLVDIIRFSNRFVGPMLRLQRVMRQLGRGEYTEPIEFRGKDLWREFADAFNAVAAHAQGSVGIFEEETSDAEHEDQLLSVS
ncbi:MAG: hypothetical protein ABFC63_07225 [Thermoguttaceae bacterium]